MAMPTTRRERYLFYRERALRRKKKLRNRWPTKNSLAGDLPGGYSPTKRQLDTSGAPLQAARSYPRHDRAEGNVYPAWVIRPRRGQWGVPLYFRPAFYWQFGVDYQPERPYLFYAFRRVHWIPRLRQLAPLPWSMPKANLLPSQVYPFAFYPSGQPSYASLQGWV